MRDVFYRVHVRCCRRDIRCRPLNITAAFATEVSSDSLKLAPGVVKAPGYETPATSYVVANATSIYSDHSFYDTEGHGRTEARRPRRRTRQGQRLGMGAGRQGRHRYRLRLDFDAVACRKIQPVREGVRASPTLTPHVLAIDDNSRRETCSKSLQGMTLNGAYSLETPGSHR